MLIIYADGALLHHSAIGDKYNAIYEKKLKTEVNKAGSFEFVMPPTHALYDSLERFKTKIQIWQDSTLLFDGRVLEMNDTINNERKVYCEGNLSYLLDSLAAPYEGTMTVSAYLTKRIQEHNAQVEADKRFTLRTIDAELGAKTVDTQSTSYTDTRADLDENIINVYGGFLVTENQNGTLYLDYLKTIDVLGDQPLEFGFNLTDFTKNTPSTDVYSILLPTGDDDLTIESVNGGSKYIENATLIQKFGRIYHQESFNGISSAAELLSEATEYFNRVAQSILTPTFSIQVADFSNYTDGYAPFVVGRKYKMLSPAGEMCIYQAYTIDYDLDTFGNTTIEFVDPVTQNLSLNRRRSIGSRNSSSAASSKRAGSGGKSSGINLKYYHEGNDSAKIIASDIGLESSSTHIAVKDKFSLIATDGDWAEFVENGGVGSIVEVDPRGFRSISGLLTSAFGKFKGADGTAILQNMEAITQFAGQFTVDSEGVVRLKDGASLMVKKDGVYSQVGTVTEIGTVDGRVTEMQGTTFWQNRDSITQTAGKFQIDAQGNLHIIDGSGLYLGTGQGSLAVYKQGDITARFIVDQINGGTATIQGNHINMSANSDFNLKVGEGDVAANLSVECGNVTFDGVNLIVSGYITSDGLITTLGNFSNDIYCRADITGRNVIATTSLAAPSITLNQETLSAHSMQFMSNLWMIASDESINLAHYHAISASASGGQITITQGAAQSTAGTATFNIADTQFYRDGVAAARPHSLSTITLGSSDTGTSTQTVTVFCNADEEYDLTTTVNASAVYNAGWSGAGIEADAENGVVKTAKGVAAKSLVISATAPTFTYNDTTHKYTATAKAKAGNTEMHTASAVSGTEAYDDGDRAGAARIQALYDAYVTTHTHTNAQYDQLASDYDDLSTAYNNYRASYKYKGLAISGNKIVASDSGTATEVTITVTAPYVSGSNGSYSASANAKYGQLTLATNSGSLGTISRAGTYTVTQSAVATPNAGSAQIVATNETSAYLVPYTPPEPPTPTYADYVGVYTLYLAKDVNQRAGSGTWYASNDKDAKPPVQWRDSWSYSQGHWMYQRVYDGGYQWESVAFYKYWYLC